MAKCLVLGANGFIGSHLVEELAQRGNEIVAFDRFGAELRFKDQPNISKIYGNFLNKADLTEALKGVDYVFHFISTTNPATAENDPLIDIETNIRMSVELFQLCVDAKVKRVIFASTGGAIYGQGDGNAFSEDDITHPISPYAIGKLSIENYLRYFRVKHGLNSTTVRIANPYGERQPLHARQGVIPVFLENILNDRPLTVLGDGSMVRDYIYVKDVVRMVANIFDGDPQYDTYNIGSGGGASINDLVTAIEGITGKPANLDHKPVPSTFVHSVTLNTQRYQDEFGKLPLTDLDTGLRATMEYIKEEIGKTNEG